MEHSGFLELFGVERAGDLGDLILRLREGALTRECFAENLCEMEGFSCIQPFANPGNLHELQLEDVERLLRFVAEETSFETVVIDFGGGFSEFDRMLGNCKEIYCLTRRGFYYECCCRNFKDYLDRSAVEHLSERMRIVEIPYSARSIRGGGDVLRQLLWSEFGDLVRGQLAGM
jgi:hypothetical protein